MRCSELRRLGVQDMRPLHTYAEATERTDLEANRAAVGSRANTSFDANDGARWASAPLKASATRAFRHTTAVSAVGR